MRLPAGGERAASAARSRRIAARPRGVPVARPGGNMLAALPTTAYEFGALVGAVLVLLLPLAGIGKCIEVMRRPRTNAKCLAALLLFCTALVARSLAALAPRLLGADARPLTIAGSLLGALLLLASLVLAIVGLATHDRARHVQGRAQGISAVILSSLLLLVTSWRVAQDLLERQGALAVAEGPPGVHSFPELNFELTSSRPWVSLDPKVVAPDACLALRRTDPEILCVVVAELGGDSFDQAALVEISMANLKSASELLERRDESVRLGAHTFTRVVSRTRIRAPNQVLAYEHWILVRHGFAWQIIVWTADAERARLAHEARALVQSFRVLDPAREADAAGTLEDRVRPELGFATRLAGDGWLAWPELGEDVPLASFGARRVNEALVVAALRVDGDPPALEPLCAGLLASVGLEYPGGGAYRSQPWQPYEGAQGLEITTEQAIDGDDFSYVLRVARGRGCVHFLAGWARVPGGEVERVRRALERVTLQEPEGMPPRVSPEQRNARGLVWNNAGLSLLERGRAEPASGLFALAYEESGDPTTLDNLTQALEALGRFEEARARLEPELAKFPGRHDLHLRLARLLVECGRTGEATTRVLERIASGLDDEELFLDWLALVLDAEPEDGEASGSRADPGRTIEDWLARRDSVEVRRMQARFHVRAGEPERARAVLEPLDERTRGAREVLLDLGFVENELGQHDRAAETAQRILSGDPDDPDALLLLAWSQLGRGWPRDAKATFERAARARPADDEEARAGARLASAALGQGDNTDVRTPLEPVPVPEALARALEDREVAADFGHGEASVFLLQMTGYHFEKGEPVRRTETQRARALTRDGAAQLGSLRIGFDALEERVYPDRVEVKDAEGRVVARATLDDAYVSDPDTEGMADERRLLQLPVPGVQPGRTLEWQVTFEKRSASEDFGFERHIFAAPVPVALQAVFVSGDVDALASELSNGQGVEILRGDGFVAWIVPNPPLYPEEPLVAWPERHNPMLWLCGESSSWAELAGEYLAEIRDRLELDADVAELSAQLTAGLTGERAKIAALAAHVQREISYRAIEFGVRGRRPNAAAETLRLRYGDCKDHALLLHELLAAARIESHLALVSTEGIVQPGLPSLDQFDHMVLHVPALGAERLLDPTDKRLDLVRFPADGLWESRALVLDPAQPRLLEPAPRPADGFRIRSRRRVTPVGADWRVEERMTFDGYVASWTRGFLAGLPTGERTLAVQSTLSGSGNVRVLELALENLDALHEPLEVALTYLVPNAISSTGRRRSATLPALWEDYYLGTPFVPLRRTAFEWSLPLSFESEVSVQLPAAARVEAPAARGEPSNGSSCAWKLEPGAPEPGGAALTLHFACEAAPASGPAERYAEFHEQRESVRRAWATPLVWEEPP